MFQTATFQVENSFYENKMYTDMDSYKCGGLLTPPTSHEDSSFNMQNKSPQGGYFQPVSESSNSESSMCYTINEDQMMDYQALVVNTGSPDGPGPYMEILEQPIDKFRFRYKSEMTGTHGSLNGMNNDKSRKVTYPTIKLHNFNQPAVIRCSIYQINSEQYDSKPHAHRLVKKQGSREEKDDPHDLEINAQTDFIATFANMGIIHTAKKNLVGELKKKKTQLLMEEIARKEGKMRELNKREEVEIKGLAEQEAKSINLNIVCLRFDAFYRRNDIIFPICKPVFSHGINNLKSALTGELKIVRMDHVTSPAKGNLEVFLLVERVTKGNIKIRFYETDNEDNVVWEDWGRFSPLDVHHQYAIVLKTPPYKNKEITSPVKVLLELVRPSDDSRSEAKDFTYVPSTKDYRPGCKRMRSNSSYYSGGSSSFSSNELVPQPIEDIKIGSILSSPFELSSEELNTAAKNIDSSEFMALWRSTQGEYMCQPGMNELVTGTDFISTDGEETKSSNAQNNSLVSAMRDFKDITNCFRTKPTKDTMVAMLKNHIGQEGKTNLLHVFVGTDNNLDKVKQLVVYTHLYNQVELLNTRNVDFESALHIATYRQNVTMIMLLMKFGASIGVINSQGNTPIHTAVSGGAINVLQCLLNNKNVSKYIDEENNDGDTPLKLALDNNSIPMINLLCEYGASINKRHSKNGYTPLRIAIENSNREVVNFILGLKGVDPTIEDYQGINAIQAAISTDYYKLISEAMESRGLKIEIKQEAPDPEDPASEEEMEVVSVKEEVVSAEELEQMYEKVDHFTEDCLRQVNECLDKSGNWRNLAELLEFEHLLHTDLLKTSSPTISLLKYAENAKESIFQIRNLLESLDEDQAVKHIDDMVKTMTTGR